MSEVETPETLEPQLPEPDVKIDNVGPARKKLTIVVPEETVQAKLSENLDSLQEEAQIPGFRRGRAPMRLLEKRFGSDVRKEVCNQLVGESYSNAVESNELRVIGEPEIKDAEQLTLPEQGPLTVEIEIEVVPEFELPELGGLEVKKPTLEVDDARINAEVDRYREMYGQLKTVEQSEHQDYLTADIEVRDASGEIVDEQRNVQMLVPGERRQYKGVVAGILIEDLGKKLAGLSVGDVVTIEAKGPERHENEKLREQDVKIDITARKIERMEPMRVDELVQAMGIENEAELREQVKMTLERQVESEQQQAMAEQVVRTLLEQVDMELPEQMSDRQAGRILQRRAMEMMYQGATQQDIEQHLAELRAASKDLAAVELKRLFVLDAVARQLDVEVGEAEINGHIGHMAAQQGTRPERLRQQMAQSGQLDQLYLQIREQKAVQQLLNDAKIEEISAEAWAKLNAPEGGEAEAPRKSKKKTTKSKSSKKADADADAADADAEAKPDESA